MNKKEMIEAIAESAGVSKTVAGKILDSFIQVTTRALKDDGKIALPGFGTLKKVRRSARQGRNPKTGAPMKVEASNVVKFSTGRSLKEAIQ